MVVEAIDLLARHTATITRRSALGVTLSGLVGGLLEGEAKSADQRRKRRRRKNRKRNKPQANAFGCLNVGDRCDGTDLQCCSGICQKQKGGKGKPRKAFCVAHGEGGCRPDQDACDNLDSAANQCDVDGLCFRTTGQAGFCAQIGAGQCVACSRDLECEAALGFGAACVVCEECANNGAGTGCVPPATGQPPGPGVISPQGERGHAFIP